MRALVFSEEGGLRLDADRPEPVPAEGEALIRVRRAGICSTVRQQQMPRHPDGENSLSCSPSSARACPWLCQSLLSQSADIMLVGPLALTLPQ